MGWILSFAVAVVVTVGYDILKGSMTEGRYIGLVFMVLCIGLIVYVVVDHVLDQIRRKTLSREEELYMVCRTEKYGETVYMFTGFSGNVPEWGRWSDGYKRALRFEKGGAELIASLFGKSDTTREYWAGMSGDVAEEIGCGE